MEEKKAEIPNSIWPFFSTRNNYRDVLRKRNINIIPKSSLGYTLVELLIVVGVLGILVTGSLLLINPSQYLKKTSDADRKSDLKLLQSALELYRTNEGTYPPDNLSGAANSLSQCSGSLVGLEGDSCPLDMTTANMYVQSVPTDPKLNTNYYYDQGNPVNGYSIYACLENTSDPEAVTPSNAVAIKTAMGCNSSSYALFRVQNL